MIPEISILIPCYNSAKSIAAVTECIISCLSDITYEIILVNDGSRDKTQEILLKQFSLHPDIITCIEFDKNYGEFNAVMCGMNHCKGNYVVIIDDDMQQNPADIPKMYTSIKVMNFDVVYAKYLMPNHTKFRNYTSFLSHFIINIIYRLQLDSHLSSFKIIKRNIVDEIIKYKGPFPFIDGLILKYTHRIANITVEHNYRVHGKSNYSLSKLTSFFISILSSHTTRVIFFLFQLSLITGIVYYFFRHFPVLVLFTGIISFNTLLITRYIKSNFSKKHPYAVKSIIKKTI